MSSQLFDAQLLVPDNYDSHRKLVELIAAGNFTGRGLPDVAHKYLDAFCSKSYSNGRRRWTGIALVGMMRASANVVQHFMRVSRGLFRIGAVVLDREETEERRIIAGLIIRQGLEAGIDFANFWESRKLLNSASNFPKKSSEHWMSQYQTYLDTVSDLVLADLNTDAVVMYPISLSTQDGFQWAGRSAVTLIEGNTLTMIVSDSMLTEFRFLDIPLGHIKETSLQQHAPHEGQESRSGHVMHTLTMILRHSSPSYRLNAFNHTTTNLEVSFLHRDDANEFQKGLQDARKTFSTIALTRAEAAESTGFKSSHENLRESSVHRINWRCKTPHNDNANRHSEPNSAEKLDEFAISDHSRQKQCSTQHSGLARGRGKLPSISKVTKQRVVRTQQLPSAPSKVTKPRAAKRVGPVIDSSEDEGESEASLQDEFDLTSTAQTCKYVNSRAVRRSQGRRKMSVEDEDFVPKGSKAKSTSAKRKQASSDAAEHSQPTKKKQTKPSAATGSLDGITTAKKQKALAQENAHTGPTRAREPMMQSTAQHNIQNGISTRHPLIEGLIKSKSPSKAAAPTFKKPGQPASTPGRPRTKPVRTTPKPQTPHDTRKTFEGLPLYVSSTPRSRSIHEEDFGLGYTPADTEILSSNTKRVPDSPHAESTAISGHANQDDVYREKCIGDLETAKSDPFQHRRKGQKMTTFIRKLTGEDPLSMPEGSLNDHLEADELTVNAETQSLPKYSPSLFKHRAQSHRQPNTQNPPAHTRDFGHLSGHPPKLKTTTVMSNDASRSPRPEATRGLHPSKNNLTYTQRQSSPNERSSPVPTPAMRKDRDATGTLLKEHAEQNDSDVSALRESIEDTLLEQTQQQVHTINSGCETTLICEDVDMPEHFVAKAQDLRFRSSPPIPDSSSVRDGSDESETEVELSPPTSRIDELEWEESLQPHQRDLHEQLLRTSKRVMRHIVDNETAVTDIADVFTGDGERLLNLMLEEQNIESAEVFQDLDNKRQDLLKELSDTSKDLRLRREQVRAAE